jgi:hypothetical protein
MFLSIISAFVFLALFTPHTADSSYMSIMSLSRLEMIDSLNNASNDVGEGFIWLKTAGSNPYFWFKTDTNKAWGTPIRVDADATSVEGGGERAGIDVRLDGGLVGYRGSSAATIEPDKAMTYADQRPNGGASGFVYIVFDSTQAEQELLYSGPDRFGAWCDSIYPDSVQIVTSFKTKAEALEVYYQGDDFFHEPSTAKVFFDHLSGDNPYYSALGINWPSHLDTLVNGTLTGNYNDDGIFYQADSHNGNKPMGKQGEIIWLTAGNDAELAQANSGAITIVNQNMMGMPGIRIGHSGSWGAGKMLSTSADDINSVGIVQLDISSVYGLGTDNNQILPPLNHFKSYSIKTGNGNLLFGATSADSMHVKAVADFDADVYAPNATWTNELIIYPSSVLIPSGNPPTRRQISVGASGGVLEDVLGFATGADDMVYFTFHYPSDLVESVNVEFHLMWLPQSGWTSGNYVWALEYIIKAEGANYTTGTPTTITMDVTPANATDFIETVFSSTIDLDKDEILICRFYRDVSGDSGDDEGLVRFFEIKYTGYKIPE